jgi:uncharacterized damage-inducible protein DinB
MNPASLANRIREVILNGKWIANTNLREQITGLSLEIAQKKVGSHNSIAALSFHTHYYLSGVLRALETGVLDIKDQYSFDMPDLIDERAWVEMQQKIWDDAEKFASFVQNMTPEQLNADFVNPKYGSVERNINAIIEHSYYHLGQIVLIRKLIGAQK